MAYVNRIYWSMFRKDNQVRVRAYNEKTKLSGDESQHVSFTTVFEANMPLAELAPFMVSKKINEFITEDDAAFLLECPNMEGL